MDFLFLPPAKAGGNSMVLEAIHKQEAITKARGNS